MAARLKERYEQEVGPALLKEFGYKNVMQLPTVHKIVINIGLGEAISNAKAVDAAVNDLKIIAARSRWLPRPRNPSRSSRCAQVWKSAPW